MSSYLLSSLSRGRQQHMLAARQLLTVLRSTTATWSSSRRIHSTSGSQQGAVHSAASTEVDTSCMSDADLVAMVRSGQLAVHRLEQETGNARQAVNVRRQVFMDELAERGLTEQMDAFALLPNEEFDYDNFYSSIEGTNCEAVVGYVPVPVGAIGPLVLDGSSFRVPMATTEGALVASTNRGCRAMAKSGGAASFILKNGMTRAPLVRVPSVARAAQLKAWIDDDANRQVLIDAFNSTTRFGRCRDIQVHIAGRNVFLRFACHCGDAMGMNMVTKGTTEALQVLTAAFPDVEVVSMSGNVCADKKSAAINWVEGRGRSVVAETVLKREVVEQTLKTTVDDMIAVNINKNLVGSAVAGALGGFNAHAANIVAAVFLATGNDIAQVVESSQCITLLERQGEDLHMSVSMPSIEVGTVGGGTTLPAQMGALKMIGCQGANRTVPGSNADTLARVVAGSVLAGEISLIAALASGDLLKSHMLLNRRKDSAGAAAAASSSPSASPSSSPAPPSSSGAASGAPSSSRVSTHSYHTQGYHTSHVPMAVTSFGHPSSGGPRCGAPPQVVPCSALPPLEALSVDAAHSSVADHDDLYGEGPLLPVP